MKASWQGKTIAQSSKTVVVEGNHYFPADSVAREFLEPSDHHSTCPWKGEASYWHVVVDGKRNDNAAWFYPEPKEAAKEIRGRIAFWKGIQVEVD